MRITRYIQPNDLNEAYERLVETKGAVIMAGGMFLRLQHRTLPLVIDLGHLGLDGISSAGGLVTIGAMTPLRCLETSQDLPDILKKGTRQVAGVAVRNMATVGGSIMGRYPFSDVACCLLALDAKLKFHYHGEMTLQSFLDHGLEGEDILLEVFFEMPEASDYKSFRKTYTDFPTVAVGVVKRESYTVAIGARPGRAKKWTYDEMNRQTLALEAFEFSSDRRASAEYRKQLAAALLEDIMEGGM
ncbi:FAD binding domain-containing protein [Fusibacter tunisiensis]|uniref:CO/xanthine dehydrogenase FAD-binding subunit n=1 Tax=Fusibacter tunisiensis TaxID=1008308 RepID=A0ABS2MQR0_9FIRM|nr:FAD binding domain-containing protein [Fusibacter tunisiensis]MBM7561724.1 CO/xanthine dehydrogenase FAD-binding subunit [Fusibacter tunisiensis]